MDTDYSHLIPFGYAPGGYMGRCFTCETRTMGVDKRASSCLSCAEKAYEASKTAHLGGGI